VRKIQIAGCKTRKSTVFSFAGAKLWKSFDLCKQIFSIFASIKINNVLFRCLETTISRAKKVLFRKNYFFNIQG
jgi:hypothetical protein